MSEHSGQYLQLHITQVTGISITISAR